MNRVTDWMRLAGRRRLRVAGLMSGTSADGVDAAIADIGARRAFLVAWGTFPYPPDVRAAIFRLFDPQQYRVYDLCHMNSLLGEFFAAAVRRLCRRSGVPLESLDLIGSHGQTVWHMPQGRRFAGRRVRSTLQIGEPSVIAERTGVTTIADFRPRDMAAGGEGAPLVPLADHFLLSHPRRNRAVQNIGGIANVTWLPAGGGLEDVRAFDTGPGNMVMDRITFLLTRGRRGYDAGGRLAAGGMVNGALLAEWMSHPFLRRRPPKTTGREEFGAAFTDGIFRAARKRRIPARDILATATAFTAGTISEAYRSFLPAMPDEVILCGGGSANRTLAAMIEEQLRPAAVRPIEAFGIPCQAKEALSFAVLAWRTMHGLPGNVPGATGAQHPAILGKITPA